MTSNLLRNGQEARDVAAWIPLDRLVLETDAPYFVPENLRGILAPESQVPRWSHPLQVLAVAVKVAEVRGVRVGQVLSQCRANVARVYKIPLARQKRFSVNSKDEPKPKLKAFNLP